MAYTRFRWRPYPSENNEAYAARLAKELKTRSVLRSLYPAELERKIKCVAGCRRLIHANEVVYTPTKNPGPDNTIAAHVECVNAACSNFNATVKREAKAIQTKEQLSKGLLPIPSDLDIEAQLIKLIETARREGYERGFRDGQQAVNTKLAQRIAALFEDEPEVKHQWSA